MYTHGQAQKLDERMWPSACWEVILTNKKVFYQLKVYCYNSVIGTLERFVRRKGFTEKCELLRKRSIANKEYGDVYDGQVWKDFLNIGGQPFLNKEKNYAFQF